VAETSMTASTVAAVANCLPHSVKFKKEKPNKYDQFEFVFLER